MKIVIAGGSGFLGHALTNALARERHDIVVLSRAAGRSGQDAGARFVQWVPNGRTGSWTREVDGADGIVNLAGESIAGKRWTPEQKAAIQDSRVHATRSLVEAIKGAAVPPAVLVSGSAVGYYGPLGEEIATEDTPPGSDFLARVCVRWEAEAQPASSRPTRVVCVRTGLVLDKRGGALPKMLLPFKLGVGGRVGSGRQYWPWIHVDDWVELVRCSLVTTIASGPVNATAPSPVTNAEFVRHLGQALHRPAFVPAPAFALRAALGEMADALLLSGQRAVPAKAQKLGFTFRYSQLDEALRAIFGTYTPRAR